MTPATSTTALVRGVLRRSFDGHAWHGPSLADALENVDAASARTRAVPGGHTIWELTHHVMAWTREVTRRLGGSPAAMPVEGDYPEPFVEPDAQSLATRWARLRADLADARDALLAAVDAFPAERLGERVGTSDDPAIGGQQSYGDMLVGLAEHNAYHGGQVVLLRRAIAGSPNCSPAPATAREPEAPNAGAISES